MIKEGKILKTITFMFIAILLTIVVGEKVMAAHPNSIGTISEGGSVGSYSDAFFHIKTSGKYKAFCTSGINSPTPAGRSCSLMTSGQWNESQQAGVAAIITEYKNGKINGSYNSYWYAEVAINSYLKPGSIGHTAESYSMVKNLVNKAKEAAKEASTNFTLSLSSSNLQFTKSGNYYVSNKITVKDTGGYMDSFDVSVSGTSKVEVINKTNNSFQVRFPASNVGVGKTVTVTAKVTGKKSYNVAKNYYCGGNVQNVTIDYVETKNITASKQITGKVTRDGNKVEISKVDVTNGKELAGATLVLKNESGKQIDKWVSTTKPHVITNLEAGKYTLTETIAPKGYDLSKKTITFTVKEDGKTTKVKMENTPTKTGALISKIDVTNGKELPGATLVVKDAKGKQVAKWVSTSEPKYLELEPGKYTLTETIAPKGYKLSKKTVSFTVKEDGTTTKVVMENEPNKTGALISKVDVTNGKELPGATLRVLDEKGEIVVLNGEKLEWVSTNEPKYFELKPGKYTLVEVIAPKGYKLSEKKVTFTVKEDETTKVVMENEPSKSGVKISKKDITTKKELPGATLVVKDANGNEVARWVSGNEPHYIELEPGDYTLTEISAPDGYDLSYEVVKFTVDSNGNATSEVVMYNSKTPQTSDKNILFTIIGLIGTGIVGAVAIRKIKHQM